jgi:hypothetical protein
LGHSPTPIYTALGDGERAEIEAKDVAKSFWELVARTGTAKTQSQMAKAAGMKQPSWAKLEGQSDMMISTLHKVMWEKGDAALFGLEAAFTRGSPP